MQVVATAGHVDHGKSALVRALTGQEPDRLAEERRRGLTIDLGFVWSDLSADGRTVTVAFVDVPGHDRFLTNMLAGVGAVDEVLFVVAADDGWAAQSEEHLEIVTVLGRRIVAVAVTKATPAGPDRTAEVVADVRARLARVGARGTPVLAVDALDGLGLEALRTTLVEWLATSPDGGLEPGEPATGDQRFPRLWIDRVFSVAGAGTVVTGTLTSGRLERGDQVALLPGDARGRIRDLRSLEVQVEGATAPARVAVALAGVDSDQVERGAALVGLRADGAPAGVATTALDVWLQVLPHGPIGHRGAWQVHLGTARREARVLPLLGELQPGERGPARIEVDGLLPARIGDRFVLREVGQRVTAAGGSVLEVAPEPARRGVTERLLHAEALEAIHEADGAAARIAALVALRDGAAPVAALEAALGEPLAATLGSSSGPDASTTAVRAAQTPHAGGPLVLVDGLLVEQARYAAWQAAAATAARDEVRGDPVVTRDQLAAAVQAHGCPASLAPAVLSAVLASGEVVEVGGRVVHRDHLDGYQAGRRARQEQLLSGLAGPGLAFIDADQVADEYGLRSFELRPLLDAGEVVQRDGVVFTPATVERALADLDAGPAADRAAFTASDARQAWKLTRKHAMPLLEHLRAAGHTTFDGTHHRRVHG